MGSGRNGGSRERGGLLDLGATGFPGEEGGEVVGLDLREHLIAAVLLDGEAVGVWLAKNLLVEQRVLLELLDRPGLGLIDNLSP